MKHLFNRVMEENSKILVRKNNNLFRFFGAKLYLKTRKRFKIQSLNQLHCILLSADIIRIMFFISQTKGLNQQTPCFIQ